MNHKGVSRTAPATPGLLIRSRMLEVKSNMKGNYTEYHGDECRIIGILNEDTQEHLLNCPVINASKLHKESEYSNIFAMSVNIQINITKINHGKHAHKRNCKN